jgi:hypothetical protein
MKELIANLNKLAASIGFGKGLKSYDKLYKTNINTFGRRDASMWFFTISLTTDNLICGIEVNSTYFKQTKQTEAINKLANFDNPITFEQAFKLIG